MRRFYVLSFILLAASLSACQLYAPKAIKPESSTRLQGTVYHSQGQWVLQPCGSQNSYIIDPPSELSLELIPLLADSSNGIFADLNGRLNTAQQRFTPSQRYRLQAEGHGCDDPDFARLQLRASGNEPFWSILQTPRGLIFNQIDQPSIVLPYIEEQQSDGRFQISSQANNQNFDLWITPGQCTDSMSGTISHLHARLQWNQHTFNGCAAFGALRN